MHRSVRHPGNQLTMALQTDDLIIKRKCTKAWKCNFRDDFSHDIRTSFRRSSLNLSPNSSPNYKFTLLASFCHQTDIIIELSEARNGSKVEVEYIRSFFADYCWRACEGYFMGGRHYWSPIRICKKNF